MMEGNRFLLRWVLPFAGSALAIIVVLWLYRDLDVEIFLASLTTAEPLFLVALGATILLEQLIRGWKWRQILYDLKPIPTLSLFGAILAGYGLAVLIPLGVSPLVRAWLIARLEGLRMASVLVTTAIDRFIDGIVFAMFAGLVAFTTQIPGIEGNMNAGLALAGALNFILFSTLLYVLFIGRSPLGRDDTRVSRWVDWLAVKGGRRFDGLRSAIRQGIIWPHQRARQVGAVLASVLMKLLAATHFLWAGLSLGVLLDVLDYLFLMVFAGFALVLARVIRVPGGFVIGSGLALKLLDVADEQALAMILFTTVISNVLMVGIGCIVFWRSGVDIHAAKLSMAKSHGRG